MTDTTATTDAGEAGEGTSQGEARTAEWYESELTKVRQEAAANRVKGREKADAARAEVTNEFTAKLTAAEEAHNATKGELGKLQREVIKIKAALAVDNVPKSAVAEFASLLQGDSEEEITAHAETVSKLFSAASRTPAIDPSPQGNGNAMPLNGDPVEQALKSALGIQ